MNSKNRDLNLKFLLKPKEMSSEFFELLEKAEKRIIISVLYIFPDEIGERILDSLKIKKQQNPEIDIKIFLDYNVAQNTSNWKIESLEFLTQKLKNTWIDCYLVNNSFFDWIDWAFHCKWIVFDDVVIYSALNIKNFYFQLENRYKLDRYLKIESSIIANSFIKMFQDFIKDKKIKNHWVFKIVLARKFFNFRREIEIKDIKFLLLKWENKGNSLNKEYYKLIKEAHENIIIYTACFNPTNKLKRLLKRKLEEWVNIEIITCYKESDSFYHYNTDNKSKRFYGKLFWYLISRSSYLYEQFLKFFVFKNIKFYWENLNISLWQDSENIFHVKWISIDNFSKNLITGHNMNNRSDYFDVENWIIIYFWFEKEFKKEYDFIKKHTKKIWEYNDFWIYPDFLTRIICNFIRTTPLRKLF